MTADREALLAGIVAAPDDDLPRLVYADWLEERGDPDRAAFIRLQVAEWADPRPWEDDPSGPPSVRVLARHRADWLPEMPAGLRREVWFERGFPASFRAANAAAEWLARAPELATVTRVELPEEPAEGSVEALPAGVRELRLGVATPSVLAALGRAGLPHLTRLDLGDLAPGAEGDLVRFAERFTRPGLASLALRWTAGLTPDQAERVAAAPLMRTVRRLTVGPRERLQPDGSDGAVALVRAVPHLTALRLGQFFAFPTAAFGPPPPGLRRLITGRPADRPVYPESGLAARLAALPTLAGLVDLSVRTYTPTLFAVDLFESPRLQKLTRLDVAAPVRPALLAHLLDPDRALTLDSLYLGRDWLTHPAAAAVREKLGPKLRAYALGSATDRRLTREARE